METLRDSSLLSLEKDDPELLERLLLQAKDENRSTQALLTTSIVPKPGFCLKTKTFDNKKVFINICTAENLPNARDITDEELLKILESEDVSSFRVPLSLGEPHTELDKGGQGCIAYDVVINPEFFIRTQESKILLGFFLTVVLEGLEEKYNITLYRDWTILKNRKFVGRLAEQNVRSASKPIISEINSPVDVRQQLTAKAVTTAKDDSEHKAVEKERLPEPHYTLIQEPARGYPQFIVAEVHLPKVISAASLSLQIGGDRIVLSTRSNMYYLDIYLPYDVIQEECGAQFNKDSKILSVTLPVEAESSS